MTTMQEFFRQDTIVGDPLQFDAAAKDSNQWGLLAEQVEESFKGFENEATTSFEGETAEAFLAVVAGLRKRLHLVPEVAYSVQDVFEKHAAELRRLAGDANPARAAAKTNWRQRDNIADNLRFAINQPDNQAQVDQLERDLETAEGYLRRSVEVLHDLSAQEDQLDRLTAQRLDEIPLGDLEDGFFDGWLGKLTAFVLLGPLGGYVFLELLEAYQENGWGGLLWKLNDFLGKALFVLAIVSLFVPGLSPWLAGLVFGLAALKLATSLTIKLKGYRNPETGAEMSWLSVGIDAISVAFAGAEFGSLVRAAQATRAASTASKSAHRLGGVADELVGAADDAAVQAQRFGAMADDLAKFGFDPADDAARAFSRTVADDTAAVANHLAGKAAKASSAAQAARTTASKAAATSKSYTRAADVADTLGTVWDFGPANPYLDGVFGNDSHVQNWIYRSVGSAAA